MKMPLLVITGCYHQEWHQMLSRSKFPNHPLLIEKESPVLFLELRPRAMNKNKETFCWVIRELCWPFYTLPSRLLNLSLSFSRPLKIHPCESHWLGFLGLSVESSPDTSKWREGAVRVLFFGPFSIIQLILFVFSRYNSSLLGLELLHP